MPTACPPSPSALDAQRSPTAHEHELPCPQRHERIHRLRWKGHPLPGDNVPFLDSQQALVVGFVKGADEPKIRLPSGAKTNSSSAGLRASAPRPTSSTLSGLHFAAGPRFQTRTFLAMPSGTARMLESGEKVPSATTSACVPFACRRTVFDMSGASQTTTSRSQESPPRMAQDDTHQAFSVGRQAEVSEAEVKPLQQDASRPAREVPDDQVMLLAVPHGAHQPGPVRRQLRRHHLTAAVNAGPWDQLFVSAEGRNQKAGDHETTHHARFLSRFLEHQSERIPTELHTISSTEEGP